MKYVVTVISILHIALSVYILYWLCKLGLNFIKYLQGNSSLDFARKYWTMEKQFRWYRIIIILIAVLSSVMCYYHMLNPICAAFYSLPLALCMYQIIYRYCFNPIPDWCLVIGTVLLFLSSLQIRDNGANVLNLGINGNEVAKRILRIVSLIIGASNLVSFIYNLLKDRIDTILSRFPIGGSNDNDTSDYRLKKSRYAILGRSNRQLLLNSIGLLICLLSIWIVLWSITNYPIKKNIAKVDKQDSVVDALNTQLPMYDLGNAKSVEKTSKSSENTTIVSTDSNKENGNDQEGLPLLAYLGLISACLCTTGCLFSKSLSEEALLKAEYAYLGCNSTQLVFPRKRKQNNTQMWREYFQVYLHLIYCRKININDPRYETSANSILKNVLEQKKMNENKGVCYTKEILYCLSCHRTFLQQIFLSPKGENMTSSDKIQRSAVFSNLMTIFHDDIAEGNSFSPLWLFQCLCDCVSEGNLLTGKESFFSGSNLDLSIVKNLALANTANQYIQNVETEQNDELICDRYSIQSSCFLTKCPITQKELCQSHYNSLWRALITFPYYLSLGVRLYANNNEDPFDKADYLSFYKVVANKNQLLIKDIDIDNKQAQRDLLVEYKRAIEDLLHYTKKTTILDILDAVWKNFNYNIEKGTDYKAGYPSHGPAVLLLYESMKEEIDLTIDTILAGNTVMFLTDHTDSHMDENVEKWHNCIKLLCYLTISIKVS